MSTYGPIIPAIRYADAPGAIEVLTSAFGFSPHLVVRGDGETIDHAQLSLDGGMVMLGSASDDDPFSNLGVCSVYVIVEDPDSHHDVAVANGAEIVLEPHSPEYGGRNYTARDPEGNFWSFGSYDPE